MTHMPPDSTTLTHWLAEWRGGNQEAADRLFTAAYEELRRLAAWHLQKERPGHTLQPTALVNELYLKLFGGEPIIWQNRAHFFAVAAQQLRRLLIDHARARQADKREGDRVRLSLSEVNGLATPRDEDLIELDEALLRLETLDPRSACDRVAVFRRADRAGGGRGAWHLRCDSQTRLGIRPSMVNQPVGHRRTAIVTSDHI